MTIPTIKSYDEFCARRKIINTTDDTVLCRSKYTGAFYNNVSVSYEHIYDSVTTTTNSVDEQGAPVVTTETNKTSVSHKINLTLDGYITLNIGESIGNVSFTLLTNTTHNINVVFDGSNFIYDSQIIKMGSFIKTNDFVLNVPKCDPIAGDSINITVENIVESFDNTNLNDLITDINQNSKILFVRNSITTGDQRVLDLGSNTVPTFITSVISGTIDNNRSKDVYADFKLEGGKGLPRNLSDIDTGPTPLVHINYSERENDVIVLAKIYKVINNKYSENV